MYCILRNVESSGLIMTALGLNGRYWNFKCWRMHTLEILRIETATEREDMNDLKTQHCIERNHTSP